MTDSSVVPLVCGFRRRDNLLAWRELFTNLYELKSLAFDFGRNTSTLCYRVFRFNQLWSNLVKFRQIIPEIMTNESLSGNFDILNICLVASIYATRLAYF